MVVSFDILTLLAVIELIVLVVHSVLMFAWSDEEWNHVTRLITASILTLINVAELPMQIIAGKFYGLTIACIVLWFLDTILSALRVGNDN